MTTEEIKTQQLAETELTTTIDAHQVGPLADIPSITIGELLRSKREQKGLNLKTISQQTKVLMGLLENLENDELTKLPSKTYVRGFVKSAAKILGINQAEALAALEYTYGRSQNSLKVHLPNIEIQNEAARNTLTSMVSTPIDAVKNVTASSIGFLAKSAVAILILGIVAFNVKNLIDRTAEEKIKLPQVLSTIRVKTKPVAKTPDVKAETKASLLEAKANAEPIKVNIIQDKKDLTQKTDLTINDVNLKSVSLGEKQFTEDKTVTNEELEVYFPAKYKVNVVKGVENVFINAVDGDSWITYKIDDKDIKKYVLRQGRTVFLRGEKIRLFLGNTKAVKVFYNNKLINFSAKSGIKNLVFPEELKTKFLNPLFVFQKDGTALTSEDYIKLNKKETVPQSAPSSPVTPTQPLTPAPVAAPAKKTQLPNPI